MAPKILKAVAVVLGALLLALAAYVAYVVLSYERLGDELSLAVEAPLAADESPRGTVEVGAELTVVAANIGFGAYNRDFDFFMDGGTGSVAASPEVVREDVVGRGRSRGRRRLRAIPGGGCRRHPQPPCGRVRPLARAVPRRCGRLLPEL